MGKEGSPTPQLHRSKNRVLRIQASLCASEIVLERPESKISGAKRATTFILAFRKIDWGKMQFNEQWKQLQKCEREDKIKGWGVCSTYSSGRAGGLGAQLSRSKSAQGDPYLVADALVDHCDKVRGAALLHAHPATNHR